MAINVLVTDDSGVMRSMIIKSMGMCGMKLGEVYQAANGQEGLAQLAGNWIDLVFVDINMPVMNGEEMIERMKAQDATADIPIIVISTEGSQTRIEALAQRGVKFIHKPFTPEKLRDIVAETIGTGAFDG
ncbi:MAG: response regulator [Desulfobacterales bacterium]|jgi:two-component system chemotaxis response regulator CheY